MTTAAKATTYPEKDDGANRQKMTGEKNEENYPTL